MSKSHKNTFGAQKASMEEMHAGEYRTIKHDLIKILILNACYLAALLFLYYSNQHTALLERFIAKYIHM
ncbi:MAG TPA: hypothetical protein VEA59_03705 [Patescibacteria group bacterium]|nr:hypothetical protein [Patescibacteria group bacterium]